MPVNFRVADIDDFDADGRGIYVVISGPGAFSGVPCAAGFKNKLVNNPVFPNQVMAGNFRGRVAKAR